MELELRGITKRFGSLVANDRIDLAVAPGKVHALLGENGAGKTTLMNVLYGLLQPDEGEILLDGQAARFHSPKDAIAAGIGMVHQHFMLVPVFSVAENVTLGIEETDRAGLLDRRKTRKDVRELSRRYGLEVDPDALVENLPVGIQQRVEIVKALVREATVLILDEPTSVLTPAETEDLFRIIRQLKDGGTSVVFISHKLKEVQAIADTITVLRRGAVVGERPPSATEDELAALMVGRNVQLRVSKDAAKPGEVVLDVSDLTVADETGRVWVDGMSFQVRAGEILGVAGVQGNGQTELCEALMGLRPSAAGHVTLAGHDLTRATPAQRLRAGLAYVPEDRQEDGLIGDFSVADNMVLDQYDRPPFASGINLNRGAIASNAAETGPGIRRPDHLGGHAGGHAVRRQPAEGDPGPRTGARAQAAGGQPADPRAGRGLDRVRAPPDRRAARPRRGGAHRLRRTRRDLRARGPDRGHVRRQDHRLPAADRARRGTRAADGGRERRGPRPGAGYRHRHRGLRASIGSRNMSEQTPGPDSPR